VQPHVAESGGSDEAWQDALELCSPLFLWLGGRLAKII